jgi:hypothetical protein
MPAFRAIRCAIGTKRATTPVEPIRIPSSAVETIISTTTHVSLPPAVAMIQSPIERVTPVRESEAPTTKRAARTMMLLSAKPAVVSAMVTTPVSGIATIMISPTASIRGLSITNMTMAAPNRPSTITRSVFIVHPASTSSRRSGRAVQTPESRPAPCQTAASTVHVAHLMRT